MKKGFVTFTTGGKFMDLTEVLVKSLLQFSKYPVTVFALNTEVPFSYPNMDPVIRKDIASLDFGSICYEKLFASYSNPYDAGVMMDADMVVNKGIDALIEEATLVGAYPHGSLHPHDPDNQQELMAMLGVAAKTQPYVHATFLFSKESKPFLEDCYNTAKRLQSIGKEPPNKDETVLNVKLWSAGATKYSECYDPYFECIESYLRDVPTNQHCIHFSLNRSLIFHGCKNVGESESMLHKLVSFHEARAQGSVRVGAVPKVSVLMPTYNHGQYLVESVTSVLTQSFQEFEFIILNDGSPDGTAAILNSLSEKDPRIKIITNEANMGRGACRQRLLEEASCEVVAWMDSDDIMYHDRLQTQYDYMLSNPNCGFMTTGMDCITTEGTIIPWSGTMCDLANPTAMFLRKEALRVGGYNPSKVELEDAEFWERARSMGAIIHRSPVVLHRYRLGTHSV